MVMKWEGRRKKKENEKTRGVENRKNRKGRKRRMKNNRIRG
jgi:hypothetical protein